MPPFCKPSNRDAGISATVRLISTKFGWVTPIGLPDIIGRQKLKIQDG